MTAAMPRLTALALATQEANEIHALCDRIRVPRLIDGGRLSTAQRVAVAINVAEGLMQRLGQDPETLQ